MLHPIYYIDDCIAQCAMVIAVNKKVFAITTNDGRLATINKNNVASVIISYLTFNMIWHSAAFGAHDYLQRDLSIRLIAILYSDDEQLIAR